MNMSSARRSSRGIIAVAAIAALGLAGCGGDDDSASAPTTTKAESVATTALPAGSIGVSLVDVSADKMLLTPSQTSAAAGTVTFVVTNSGDKEHEFVVMKTDIAGADLPVDEATDRMDEEGEGVENVGEIGSILAGETKTLELELEPGHYVLVCNLKSHVRMGMWADFDVT